MEEYHQITLNEWMDMKDQLRRELNNVRQSYIRVGYVLRRMEDTRAYEAEGYKSVAEFAEKEHGLKPSTTSRWMSINREYSLDGYSMQLDPKYIDMNASQLTEMLGLPMEDRDMIRPETKREDIRELKRLEKMPEEHSGFGELVRKFFDADPELLHELKDLMGEGDRCGEEAWIELVSPSGNRAYRKDGAMMFLQEDQIKYKRAGHSPESVEWSEFFAIVSEMEVPDEEPESDGTAEAEDIEEGTKEEPEKESEEEQEAAQEAFEAAVEGGGITEGPAEGTEEGDEGTDESQDRTDQDDVGGNGNDGEDDETVEDDEAETAEEVRADDTAQEAAPDEEQEEELAGSMKSADDSEIAPAQNPEEENRKKAAREAAMKDVREVCWKSIEKLMNDFNSRNTAEAVKQCRRTLNYLESLQRIEEEG